MPNYFAHLIFGGKVLQALPQPLAVQLRQERAAFHLGCLGPDPLFFYRPVFPNPYRREGMKMHAENAAPAFQRLALAIREGLPQAGSYAAGFLCHLALDSACHGYINARAAAGPLEHIPMEAELDRKLMESRGLTVPGHVYLPAIDDPAVFEAAAAAYAVSGPEHLRRGYQSMRRDSLLFAMGYGKRRGEFVNWAFRHIPPCRGLDGVILRREPAPGSEESSRQILRRLVGVVPETTRQICAYLDAAREDRPLPVWLNRDFNGVRYPALSAD